MKTIVSSIEPLEARIAPATIIVTNNTDHDPGSLRAALATANDAQHPGHDTILFHLPTSELVDGAFTIQLTSGTLTSTGNVTIKGPGAGKLIIDGAGKYGVFSFTDISPSHDSPVTISGLSIIGGKTTEGAGIFSYESLTLKNVVLSGNSATAYGGAVGIAGNTSLTKISISNSIITGNTGVNDGALDLNNLKSLTITKTLISGNTASDAASFGGGLDTDVGINDAVTITGCTISNNSAGKGGGVFLNGFDSSKFTITNTIITGNAATGASSGFGGGGIFIPFGNAVITGSTISNNSANDGGGIFASGTTSLTISNCTISGNTASDVGGGFNLSVLTSLKITGTAITGNTDTSTTHGAGGGYAVLQSTGTGMKISGCTVSGNTANHGGGLFVNSYATSPAAKMTLSATKITGNTAKGTSAGGGGLYVEYGIAVVTGSTISDNKAVYVGGGISAKSFTSLTISKSTISGNQTTMAGPTSLGGAGVFIEGNGPGELPVMITGSHIIGNLSAAYAGGLYAFNGIALTISSSTFSGNHAVGGGGGIRTYGKAGHEVDLTISGSTFSDNVAGAGRYGGGIDAVSSGTGAISIIGSKFTGNTATDGGGIYAHSNTTLTLTKTVATGNFAIGGLGGGLYVDYSTSFSVSGGSFTGNGAKFGGGISVGGSTGTIEGVTISGNVATNKGGGVFESGSDITLQIAKVTANTAPTGPNTSGVFKAFP